MIWSSRGVGSYGAVVTDIQPYAREINQRDGSVIEKYRVYNILKG
jgi:hypothetical protein